MKKVIFMLILGAGFASAGTLREDAQARCQKRLDAFADLLTANKEVQFLFGGFMSAMMGLAAQQGREITPDQIMTGIARRMFDVCMKDELPKVES